MSILPAPRIISDIGSTNPERVDVPGMPDVYYVPETDNFYSRSERRGMGDAFYREHIHLMRQGRVLMSPLPTQVRIFHKLTCRLQQKEMLPMWVVYNPTTREYPGQWVARLFVLRPWIQATRFVITHDTLEDLRTLLPSWLYRQHRRANDVPEVAEVWF